jgi:hypothetical protein
VHYRTDAICLPRHPEPAIFTTSKGSVVMGKYFLAWILGVPAIVLVLIYLFFH